MLSMVGPTVMSHQGKGGVFSSAAVSLTG